MSADLVARVRAAFDAAGGGDADALPPLCAPNVVWRGHEARRPAYCLGRDDLRAWLRRVRAVIGAERFTASEVARSPAADQVVLRLRWRFPDHVDESFQRVVLRGERIVLIQDYMEREKALAALTLPPI